MTSSQSPLLYGVLAAVVAGGSLFACAAEHDTNFSPETDPPIPSSSASNGSDDAGTPGSEDGSTKDSGATKNDGGSDADTEDAAVSPGPPPPSGRCRTQADCPNPSDVCSTGSGECPPAQSSTCAIDDDCAASGKICDSPRRGCGIACIQGCSGGDCGHAATCIAQRCEPNECMIDADCGDPDFVCFQVYTGKRCMRKTCAQDTECDGKCVHDLGSVFGECWSDWGTCSTPSSN